MSKRLARLIPKNNRPVAVNEDAVLDMVSNPTRQREALAVAAEADQILGLVVVLHAGNLLFNDRPLIQILGGVVAGGADELHPAFESAAIRIRTNECWQEGVVDIDDAPGEFAADRIGEDLHEAREDDEFGTEIAEAARP